MPLFPTFTAITHVETRPGHEYFRPPPPRSLPLAQCLLVDLMLVTNLALQLSAAQQSSSLNLLARPLSSHLRTTLLPLACRTQDHLVNRHRMSLLCRRTQRNPLPRRHLSWSRQNHRRRSRARWEGSCEGCLVSGSPFLLRVPSPGQSGRRTRQSSTVNSPTYPSSKPNSSPPSKTL